jgi:NAD+ kinase
MKTFEFKKIGIITKSTIIENINILKELAAYLKKTNKQILYDVNSAPIITQKRGLTRGEILQKADMAIILGGDGTLLKTSSYIGTKKVPLLVVNLGRLGFLTELSPTKMTGGLNQLFSGKYTIDQRTLLRVTLYRNNKKIKTFLVLNEAAISQGEFARLIELKTSIDNKKITNYVADGLIFSTPTGSTGHSLSAGGPIVYPEMPAIIITPICPYQLSTRPIVIPNNETVTVEITTKRNQKYHLSLTLDGQITVPLKFGDKIKIRKSSRNLHLIRLNKLNYYKTLRDKLKWGK